MDSKAKFMGTPQDKVLYTITEDKKEVRITPYKVSLLGLILILLFFLSFGIIIAYFIFSKTGNIIPTIFPLILMSVVAISLTLITLNKSKKEQKKGAFLIFEKYSNMISLPRKGFKKNANNTSIEIVYGWEKQGSIETKVIELQLIDKSTNKRVLIFRHLSSLLYSVKKIKNILAHNNIAITYKEINYTNNSDNATTKGKL